MTKKAIVTAVLTFLQTRAFCPVMKVLLGILFVQGIRSPRRKVVLCLQEERMIGGEGWGSPSRTVKESKGLQVKFKSSGHLHHSRQLSLCFSATVKCTGSGK